MLFSAPVPFSEAIASRKVKALLPTELNSAAIQGLPAELRERASLSATVERAEFLQKFDDLVEQILNGQINFSQAKTLYGKFLLENGYKPSVENRGTIKDISSDARKTVKLRTDVDMANGYGFFIQGQDRVLLDEYPCWELFRLQRRKIPRDWIQRWRGAGGKFYGGRMIARKDSDIWTRLGPFQNPYPPFDFNSGMWTRNVSRADAIALGVIEEKTRIAPQSRDFNSLLQMHPNVRSQTLRDEIVKQMGDEYKFDGEVLRHR